ncbi:hypothetical protein [Hyphococcus sp.]|uniref:hypothetical protein n=1 Tax=Hyphococcus sp. TaxID=2038636 RepID=UPI00208AD672|nr:MAG: hypothetical protein DHS20C04_21500 [Marinicaulis sp.]
MSWIGKRIDSASWRSFIIWFVALFAFSAWAFGMDSPWTRALELAGGKLPEMQPSIPATEPVRSLQAMGTNTGDYILWQALDIPYSVMNLMVARMGIGLGLKALRMENSFLRFAMALPPIYVVCELMENALVASFALGTLSPSENVVLLQQFATTLKFAAAAPAMGLAIAGVLVAALAGALKMVRKKHE